MSVVYRKARDLAVPGFWFCAGALISLIGLGSRHEVTSAYPGQALVMDLPLILGLSVMTFMFVRTSVALQHQNERLAEAQRLTGRLAAEREAILRSITEAMMVTDEAGRAIRVNEALTTLMGRVGEHAGLADEPHAASGVLPLCREDGRPYATEELPLRRALRGETVENELVVARLADQRLYYECSSAPIRDPFRGTISGTVTLFHDISGLKRLERLKDEFISTVSHELRTPLAVIRGYAELPLLTSSPEEWGAQAEVLDLSLRKIIAEVDLMSGLINQMLHIARLEAERLQLKLCETDLVELTKAELGALTMAQADGRVHFDVSGAAGSLPVRLDRSSFRQILDNLISNAVKYSPPESPVTVQLQRAGNEALLSVADSGMGIPEDELPLVFERFYRSENALKTGVPGLGLGLHITSRLVKMMGGRITAESRQGKGSTFLVALPLLNAKLSTAGDPPESA